MFIKPLLIPDWVENECAYTTVKRKFIHALEKYTKTCDFIGIQNLDAILPTENWYFNNLGAISVQGTT